MLFYESPSTDPYYNLALEDYFFSHMDPAQDYFLLWQNDRAVIVGRYQNTLEEVDQKYVDSHGIRVARRLSGGGAVYHDLGNLNYTFIVDEGRADSFCFQAFTRPVLAALGELGITAEASGRNDITIGGKKISGSSQYVRKGRLLHHGCVMLDSDVATLTAALRVREDKIASKSIKSVRSRVTTINAQLPQPLSMETFKGLLYRHVLATEGLAPAALTDRDLAAVLALREEQYATWAWNYGRSPQCDVRKERRYPFGGITLYLTMERGTIQSAAICGDFFGRRDLGELEALLRGRRLVPEDFAPLAEVDLSQFIAGMTWEQMIDLLCY